MCVWMEEAWRKLWGASILDLGEVIESDHTAIRVEIEWKGVMEQRKKKKKALLFLQLLIALLTRSVVNVCAISKEFFFVSLVTNWVSLEECVFPALMC